MSIPAMFSSPNFLPKVLRLDAWSCLGCGVLQLALPGMMRDLTGLPAALLAGTGWFLLVYAALVWWLSRRDPLPRPAIWLIVIGNLGWAIGCVALLASGLFTLSLTGMAYVALQAATVGLLAELQYFGLRRAAPAW
jgi:hypothetical protein